MPRRCTACDSSRREDLDAELVGASMALRSIAIQHGLSYGAVLRHNARCIPAHLAEAHEAERVADADTLLERVERLERVAQTWHDRAEKLHAAAEAAYADERAALEADYGARAKGKPLTAALQRARREDFARARRAWAADADDSVRVGLAAVREITRVLKLLGAASGELRQMVDVDVNVALVLPPEVRELAERAERGDVEATRAITTSAVRGFLDAVGRTDDERAALWAELDAIRGVVEVG